MRIAFNPSTVEALITPPNNKDITFDLRGRNIFARGVKFCGTDTNTWRDIKINNVSIDSNTLDLRDGDNTTLTNINGVVTINSTWRPVVDNLTSDSTTSSLSANLGRVLKALIDGKSNSGHTHDDRYLKLTGGTVASNALITFADSGSWGTDKGPQGARGGLYWTGQSDYAKLYAEETAGDNLDLVIQFGDDNSNGLSIRNRANTQTSYISAGGVITTGTFKGNLDWSYITNKPATATRWPSWAEVTGKPSSFTPSTHTHGLSNSVFFLNMPSISGNAKWKEVFGHPVNYNLLLSVRINSPAPEWCVGNYGSGILYGGSDTKGFMSSAYNEPLIMWAGGNGSSDDSVPKWYIGIKGIHKSIYNLATIASEANAAYNLRHSHANKSVLDGITSALVNSWNTAYNFVSTITGEDTDKVINKWDEIVNFLAGITEDNKLNTLLNSKLSVYELANNTNVGAIKNNGIYYSTTDASSGTLTNSPFNTGFSLINMTSYDGGDDLRRSRLAFNAYGEIKVSNDRDLANTAETWYNVLTSKNSGISGSTIKLNGTSITVYSSSTADGRYVKKSGDTMSGVLTIDTTNFGALTIKRNDDANYASIQFRGKSNVYGYIGLNSASKDKLFSRFNSEGSKIYTILDTSSTYVSSGKGVINGTTITQVDNATNSTNSTNARKLVNWYSARPTSLNAQFGDGSLRIFYATSSTTEGKPAEDSHILHLAWDNNGGWDTQLAVHTRSGKVSTRAQNSGTWQPWKTLAFTTDIPSSLKNPYSLTTFGVVYDGSAAKTVTTSTFISLITEATATITDGTMLITSYASNSGFADTNAVNVPYKRKAIHLWEYIKAKTDSLYATKSHNHDNKYLRWLGNAGQSNMNAIGRISHSSGMTNLSDPGNTIDNPMEGGSKSTSWHLYWLTNYTDDPSGSNAWVALIVNRAGTDRWWVRSRSGGTITNNANWTSNWRFLVTAPTSGLGNGNLPVYINSAGEVVAANSYPTSLKNPHSLTLKANGTTLATYDGSSAKEANFTYANVGAASASHTHDDRYVRAFGTSNDNIDSDWGLSFKTFDPIPSGTPPEKNPNISILNIGNSFNRRKLLAFIYNNDNIYYRRHVDNSFTNWRRLAFANEIPTSLKNPHALTISLNGTSQGPYDGSAAKSINITSSSIGAATSGHTHDDRYIKKVGDMPTNAYDLIITPTNLDREHVIDPGGGIHVKAHTGTPFQLWLHDTNNVWYKKTSNGAWVKMDAGHADIASLATKLQTSRLLWGQPFNGTANVDGTINISGTSGSYNQGIRIHTFTNSVLSSIWFRATNTDGYQAGMWGISVDDNGMRFRGNTSKTATSNPIDYMNILHGGNVGIGTTNPSSKLTINGDISLFNVGSIRNLAIGGGIYWNPYVESTTDGSDAASITVVKSGVAGGTTLVLSLMNDANDTILFQTNGSARLYHNSYPILTTLNTYVSNNKGYINNTEITLVNNANKWTTSRTFTIGNTSKSVDGSSNVSWSLSEIGAASSNHNHDNRYVRKWTGVYGSANKFLKLAINDEKGWIRLEVSDSNNSLTAGYGIYIIGWGWHDNITDTLFARCLYANDSRYTTALKIVRTSRNNYDFYFLFASGSSYPSYTINYSSSISSIDCTVIAIDTIPTATWTSSLSALQLNASQVDWSGITNKPSAFNPAAHTHTVFNNNLMIKGTNGISDSASIHLGIGDSDTGFKWISDGKCLIYANNIAVGEWTSGGMNWFKNPTVNGNKIWNAGNDGSESGLDADLLDGWHLDSIRKNVGYSWSSKYRINNWSRIIKIDNYSNILLAINFSQNSQASNHLYLISTGYNCGNIVQLGANGYSSNSAIKIRLTENTATSHNVEIYSTYGYNGATELSINCNYTRIDGNSTITTYLTYTAGGGTVRKEITSSYSKIVANLQGNSDTTTKLQTPRQINGTNFDGSANVTTSYWGTTRTLTIGNSGKSVNGSANISWSLSEIGAAPSSHSHNYAANENYGGFTKSGRLPISGFYQSAESESGGNAPWSGWMHLINCLYSNTGNNYALLIAASFSNNNTFKIRVTNNNVNNAWRDIIHSGNIGSQTVANAYHLRINSANTWSTWNWSGLSGQPSWLWGSNDGTNMYVWNPSNFRVAYASSAGNADTVDGYHSSSFLTKHTREGAYNIDHLTDFVTRDLQPKSEINIEGTKPYDGWGMVTVLKTDNGTAQLVFDGSSNMYFRSSYGSEHRYVTSTWKQVANLSSNVASATKLQTARKIWGQSFDGTADITGVMTINPPNIFNGSDNTIMFKVYSSTGYKNGFAISSTDNVTRLYAKPFGTGTKNALEIHTYNNTDVNAVTIDATGNVGIGTTPSYKLHVTGDIYTTTGFKKNGSSDSYVLLGGGGHKAISDFATSAQGIGTIISISKSLTPTTSWIDTGIKTDSATFPGGNGSYIVQISIPSSSGTDGWGDLYTGYFSLFTGTNSSTEDEILLHGASHALLKRIYLKTKATANTDGTMHFYIASEKAFSAARTINFKFRKLI